LRQKAQFELVDRNAAAELLAGPWRARMNAATMHGQSKTCYQAEIDAACELVDFWRWNPHFAEELYAEQPRSSPEAWNELETFCNKFGIPEERFCATDSIT
jgi:acyl-CoA reductase-like NAD-dependent aldehyde dehydrogenase